MKIPHFAIRFTAWAYVVGLAVASWTPDDQMIRSGFLDPRLEHVIAYMVAGIFVLVAYPRKSPWSIAMLLSTYAGVLEFGQMYIPGRNAHLLDWLSSSGGVVCACVTVGLCRNRIRRST
jgi:VanZ family protein